MAFLIEAYKLLCHLFWYIASLILPGKLRESSNYHKTSHFLHSVVDVNFFMCSFKNKLHLSRRQINFFPIMKTSCSLYYFRFGTRNAHKLRTIDLAIIGRHLCSQNRKLHIAIDISVRVHNELLIISQNINLRKNSKY